MTIKKVGTFVTALLLSACVCRAMESSDFAKVIREVIRARANKKMQKTNNCAAPESTAKLWTLLGMARVQQNSPKFEKLATSFFSRLGHFSIGLAAGFLANIGNQNPYIRNTIGCAGATLAHVGLTGCARYKATSHLGAFLCASWEEQYVDYARIVISETESPWTIARCGTGFVIGAMAGRVLYHIFARKTEEVHSDEKPAF